jgi:hypothetical protein
MQNDTKPGVFLLAKLITSSIMAWLVVNYTLPFWMLVILFFIC